MSEKEKRNWVEWFLNHQDWIRPIGRSFNKRPMLVAQSKFMHDLANVLTPIYAVYRESKGGK